MSRAVVVGAGIFGVTAALELRRRGHAVTLLDPGPIPHPDAASSDTSKIVRMDYGTDAHYTAMMEEALRGWDAWNSRWDETLYHEDGFLLLSSGSLRPGGFEHDSWTLLRARGHAPEGLDAAAVAARFPDWSARFPEGYFNPRGGWAESGRVVLRLAAEARGAGVDVREGAAFSRLLDSGSRIAGVAGADGAEHLADHVILAAGAHTPVLAPWLADRLRATGHPVLYFRPADAERYRAPRFPVWAADIARTGMYGFPATADGRVKVSRHDRGVDTDPRGPRHVDPQVEDAFREFLRGAIPGLAGAPLAGTRLCLYCDSFDGDFWIDRDPDRPGLVVAAGDSGHGFKFAPVLGPLIADVVEGRPNPFGTRFRWRELGERKLEAARQR